jgi:hypothetical protein
VHLAGLIEKQPETGGLGNEDFRVTVLAAVGAYLGTESVARRCTARRGVFDTPGDALAVVTRFVAIGAGERVFLCHPELEFDAVDSA